VLAAALEAYVCVDPDGRIRAWNPAAEATFGYRHDEACGAQVDELVIPERLWPAHRGGLLAMAQGGPGEVLGHRLHLSARHRDGHEFPIEMTLTTTDGPDGRRFHAFAHDVSVTQRAQRFAATAAAVSDALARAAGSSEAATAVVDALGTQMGWTVVELWLVDQDRQVLVCAARFSGDRDVTGFAVAEVAYGSGVPGRACRDDRPVWVADLSAETSLPRNAAAIQYGLRVAVGMPISSGTHMFGALAVYGDHAEDPEDSLTGLLVGLAAQVGQFLERRRAEELTVKLNRSKDEFLALVAHELRNPLAIITGTVGLLEDDRDELSHEMQWRYIDTISRSAARLTAMTDDLLDLAQLENGELAVHLATVDLSDLLHQAVDSVAVTASLKGVTVQTQVTEPLMLDADPARLRQVADNLLSNAVKYTPAGGTIDVSAHREGADIDWIVTDTGIGIPADDRQWLFHRFYRASTALDSGIPGTGLGLVISRTIVERHHGTITLLDRPGPGSSFEIHLPVTQPH